MSKAKVKTIERKTTVSRSAVREAVSGVFAKPASKANFKATTTPKETAKRA